MATHAADADLEQIASEQLTPLINDCLDKVGERLVLIADQASSNAEQNNCFEVLGAIRHRRGGLVRDFFDSWRGLAEGQVPQQDIDEHLEADSIAQSRELVLSAEAILASHPAPADMPHCLQPELVCSAMIEAMRQQALHMDGRVYLLREFARSVLDPLLGMKRRAAEPVLWDRARLETAVEQIVGGSARRYAAWLDASGAGHNVGETISPQELCSVICRTLGRRPHQAAATASVELLSNVLRSEVSRDFGGKVIHPAEQRMVFHVLCLLERFFSDPDLDDGASGMLVRLRVSLLFCLLNEPDILDHPDHPVRQLMNELADTMLGWKALPELETTDAWRRVSKLVGRLGAAMPGDLPAFLDGLIDWRLYRARRHARLRRMGYGMHVSQTQRAVSDEQRGEVQARLAAQLRGQRVPRIVVPLFTEIWSDVLFLVRMHGDRAWTSEPELDELLQGLLQSMQPDLAVERRHEVMRNLPGLMKQLRGTLKSAGVAGEVQGAAMDAVEQVHSALLFGSRPLDSIEWVELDDAMLSMLQEEVEEEDTAVDHALQSRIPTNVWLEFSKPWHDTIRFKVYSMESDPQLAILVNGASMLVREIPWTELDRALTSGEVRVLDQLPRFDRALRLQ